MSLKHCQHNKREDTTRLCSAGRVFGRVLFVPLARRRGQHCRRYRGMTCGPIARCRAQGHLPSLKCLTAAMAPWARRPSISAHLPWLGCHAHAAPTGAVMEQLITATLFKSDESDTGGGAPLATPSPLRWERGGLRAVCAWN